MKTPEAPAAIPPMGMTLLIARDLMTCPECGSAHEDGLFRIAIPARPEGFDLCINCLFRLGATTPAGSMTILALLDHFPYSRRPQKSQKG